MAQPFGLSYISFLLKPTVSPRGMYVELIDNANTYVSIFYFGRSQPSPSRHWCSRLATACATAAKLVQHISYHGNTVKARAEEQAEGLRSQHPALKTIRDNNFGTDKEPAAGRAEQHSHHGGIKPPATSFRRSR
jgi:hypothetical protein